MKLYECPRCGTPSFGKVDQSEVSDTVCCPECGHQDYAFVFERGAGETEKITKPQGRFHKDIFNDIQRVSRKFVDGESVNSILADLTKRYRIGTENLVEIINAYLKPKTKELYNPLYFVAIDEDRVPELTIDEPPTLEEPIGCKGEGAPSELAWRERYEQSQALLANLESRYAALLEKYRLQGIELKNLRNLYE